MNKEELEKQTMEWKNNYIQKLEKENAELKADNVEWEKASDKWKSVYELTNNQLTNAKEIIREFMKYEINEYDGSLEIHFEELKKQAEQFLKDCDIDNAIQQANKGLDFDKIADEMEQDLKDSEVEK